MSAIMMQHRAQQACNACRKLKRKCTYNSALGGCDRCAEGGKPCVYDTPTALHPIPAAPSSPFVNTAPSTNMNAALNQYDELMYPDSFGSLSDTQGEMVDIAYGGHPNAVSGGSRMAGMGPGNEGTTYPSSHARGQF